MKQPRTKIAHAVAQRTLQRGVSRAYSRQLAAYLLSERRVNELNSLLRDIQADWAEAGHVEVIASSAHVLPSSAQSLIKRRFKQLYPRAKSVNVRMIHDPEVIGGVQLRLADRQLDLSIEAKLNRFKQLTNAGKD